MKSSFINSNYTTTERTQHDLPDTTGLYFSVDDFNRVGEIRPTNPGEDTGTPYHTLK